MEDISLIGLDYKKTSFLNNKVRGFAIPPYVPLDQLVIITYKTKKTKQELYIQKNIVKKH